MTKTQATQTLKALGFRVKSIGSNGSVYSVCNFAFGYESSVHYGADIITFAKTAHFEFTGEAL